MGAEKNTSTQWFLPSLYEAPKGGAPGCLRPCGLEIGEELLQPVLGALVLLQARGEGLVLELVRQALAQGLTGAAGDQWVYLARIFNIKMKPFFEVSKAN